MATTPSLKVIKSMPFKGGTRQFSNRYHFNGGTPADTAHWTTFSDNVVAAEKTLYPADTSIVETIGYAAGSDVPIFSKTYTTAGTNGGSGNIPPGEVAALVRYSTTARTPKNHPVYLFNYYHHLIGQATGATADKLTAAQVTLLNTYAALWIAGISDGTLTLHRAGPNGASATGSLTEEYFTHRDFAYSRSA